ncbi:hypothetical protein ACFPRL_07435 [Pseudoclavibacter helvolus]
MDGVPSTGALSAECRALGDPLRNAGRAGQSMAALVRACMG